MEIDYKEMYEGLKKKLEDELPITAYPIRELVQIFRQNDMPITLKTKVRILSVFNSGDISGIICTIHDTDNIKNGMACSLTHLMFNSSFHLYKEITAYQTKRVKRILQLNKMK
jgi:hypothetical protein